MSNKMSIRIPATLHKEIREAAAECGVSLQEVIIAACWSWSRGQGSSFTPSTGVDKSVDNFSDKGLTTEDKLGSM